MKTVIFESLREGAGASLVASSVAFLWAQAGRRVLAADAVACSESSLLRYFNMPLDIRKGWRAADCTGSSSGGDSPLLFRWRYSDSLELLPQGSGSGAFSVVLEATRGAGYDRVVADAGASDPLTDDDSVLRILVAEPDAATLMRLRTRKPKRCERLLFNKVMPGCRSQDDIVFFVSCWRDHLQPMSIPFDDFALQSDLWRQPLTQGFIWSESASVLTGLAAWIETEWAASSGA